MYPFTPDERQAQSQPRCGQKALATAWSATCSPTHIPSEAIPMDLTHLEMPYDPSLDFLNPYNFTELPIQRQFQHGSLMPHEVGYTNAIPYESSHQLYTKHTLSKAQQRNPYSDISTLPFVGWEDTAVPSGWPLPHSGWDSLSIINTYGEALSNNSINSMRAYSSPSECNDSNIDADEPQSPFAPSNHTQLKDIKKTKSKDKRTNTPSPSRRKKLDKLHLKDKEDHYFSCPIDDCRKKFARKTDLERHNKSVHIKERNHECTYCGRLFARKDTLRRHMDDGCPKRFDIETVTFSQANVGEVTRWTNTDIEGTRQPAGLHVEDSQSF